MNTIIKNYVLTLFVFLGFTTTSHAAVQVYLTSADTTFKLSTAQSSSLGAEQKCDIPANTLIAANSSDVVGVHLQMNLANTLAGCALMSGYFYEPHVQPESKIITIHQNTILKSSTAQASQLSASEKCKLNRGLYINQSAVADPSDGHYFVNLQSAPNGCGFGSGYIFEGHSTQGAQAISITMDTKFKTSTADSSSLATSEKCDLPIGTYVSTVPVQFAGDAHYKVNLPDAPNCGFSEGYVFYPHTHLGEPVDPIVKWEFPMPQGNLGSSWCVCRNVGTSPHIGYDIFKPSGQSAVATQDGVVSDITFSSSCGYILLMKDDFGTDWRYVHLNSPKVSEGQKVARGETLGSISQYPNSACGTGPHLHFERRSAGYFADSSSGKSCQNGYRACYWDPIKPWRAGYQAPANAIVARSNIDLAGAMPETNNSALKSTATQTKSVVSSCKVAVSDYPSVESSILDAYSQAPHSVVANVERVKNTDGELVLSANLLVGKQINNLCSNGDCVTTWSLLTQSDEKNGDLRRVFFDNKVRNYPLKRVAQEGYCIESHISQYWLLYTDKAGNKFKIAGTL